MASIGYTVICSLDGYSADRSGGFGWAEPSEQVVAYVNERCRDVTTYLYGRRMYETMAVWETDPDAAAGSPESAEFARIWQAARKVVFSTTLTSTWTNRTSLERQLSAEVVERIRGESDGDLAVDGPTLAADALRLGVVDEFELILAPVVVGGGLAVLPADLRLELRLVSERRFDNGMVALAYRVGRSPGQA